MLGLVLSGRTGWDALSTEKALSRVRHYYCWFPIYRLALGPKEEVGE